MNEEILITDTSLIALGVIALSGIIIYLMVIYFKTKNKLEQYENAEHIVLCKEIDLDPNIPDIRITLLEEIGPNDWWDVPRFLPPKGEEVQFTCYMKDTDSFTDIKQGWWEGGYTANPNVLVMKYEDEEDWLPCTHFRYLPEYPNVKKK